jgi:hypothetical protein
MVIGLCSRASHTRFGGSFGRVGGGFRMGGDGFARGNPSHTAWFIPGYISHSYGSSYSGYHPSSGRNEVTMARSEIVHFVQGAPGEADEKLSASRTKAD